MKTLNLSLSLIFTLAFSVGLIGQNTLLKEHRVKMTQGTLTLEGIDKLELTGYNGTEVIFESEIESIDDEDRRDGLRLLTTEGLSDNSGLGVYVEQDGDMLYASQISSDCDCSKVTVKVPRSINVVIVHNSSDAELIEVKNFSSELEISSNYHEISLDNVTGPMAVKTLYGNIEAKFSELSQRGSVSLYSVYEHVDITLPKNAKANVTLSTPYGDVYTNADIEVGSVAKVRNVNNGGDGASINNNNNKKSCQPSCNTQANNSSINGTLNGGGVELILKSSYEDIYLRQI